MKKLLFSAFLLIQVCTTYAQLENPISWSYKSKRINSNEAVIQIRANIEQGWHVYAINQSKGSILNTSFNFTPSKDFVLNGKIVEPKAVKKYEKALKTDVFYFEDEVTFEQKIKLNKNQAVVKGKVSFMVCNDKSCLPSDEVSFSIPVK